MNFRTAAIGLVMGGAALALGACSGKKQQNNINHQIEQQSTKLPSYKSAGERFAAAFSVNDKLTNIHRVNWLDLATEPVDTLEVSYGDDAKLKKFMNKIPVIRDTVLCNPESLPSSINDTIVNINAKNPKNSVMRVITSIPLVEKIVNPKSGLYDVVHVTLKSVK